MNTLAVFYSAPYLDFIYGSSKCEAVKGDEKHGSGTCYNLRSPRNFAFAAMAVVRDIGIAMQELHNALAWVMHAGQRALKTPIILSIHEEA
jgi:hypothetical protein